MTAQTSEQQAIGKILLRGGRGTLGSTAAWTLWLDAIPELVSVVGSKFTAEELDTITAGVVPGNERLYVPEKGTGPAGEFTPVHGPVMNSCPRCGAAMQQGPNGGWLCGNCGHQAAAPAPASRELTTSSCDRCGGEVVDGPNGGYCCGHCGHVVQPQEGGSVPA